MFFRYTEHLFQNPGIDAALRPSLGDHQINITPSTSNIPTAESVPTILSKDLTEVDSLMNNCIEVPLSWQDYSFVERIIQNGSFSNAKFKFNKLVNKWFHRFMTEFFFSPGIYFCHCSFCVAIIAKLHLVLVIIALWLTVLVHF